MGELRVVQRSTPAVAIGDHARRMHRRFIRWTSLESCPKLRGEVGAARRGEGRGKRVLLQWMTQRPSATRSTPQRAFDHKRKWPGSGLLYRVIQHPPRTTKFHTRLLQMWRTSSIPRDLHDRGPYVARSSGSNAEVRLPRQRRPRANHRSWPIRGC